MAYCRWSDGDLYIYDDVSGGITCCGCPLLPEQHFNTESPLEMAEHVAAHERAGHDVPGGIEEEFRQQAAAGPTTPAAPQGGTDG